LGDDLRRSTDTIMALRSAGAKVFSKLDEL